MGVQRKTERRQEPSFCSVAAQEFALGLLVFGDHQAQHCLPQCHTEVEVTCRKEKPALVCLVHREGKAAPKEEGLDATFAKLWTQGHVSCLELGEG